MPDEAPSRRDFLSGRALRSAVEGAGERLADALIAATPSRGPSLMLRTSAMATDFDVLLDPTEGAAALEAASTALDEVHRLEQQYSVYRPDSELSLVNARAALVSTPVEQRLFDLLQRAVDIAQRTEGAFNPAAGRLVSAWRTARREARLPTNGDIATAVASSDLTKIEFNDSRATLRFHHPHTAFDLGAIGKGYAVDQAAEILNTAGVQSYLVHGGKSSVLVHGQHAGQDGWPIALQNPLLPDRRFLTVLLKDAAFSTSGTAVQWFRYNGKRYGHVLDPRTGWPVETMLSVSVVAPDAALSDALSTAFFVLGVEKALECCDNFPEVGAILFPIPKDGRTLAPIVHGIPHDRLFFAADA